MPHVMISYQWNSQERMLKLKDELTKAGYDVWMDVDQMGKLNDSDFVLHMKPMFKITSFGKWPVIRTLQYQLMI